MIASIASASSFDVEPVAARVAVAVDRQRLVGERLGDEARDHLLGVLPGPVVVERADDHDRQPVGDEVAVREPVGAGLGCGVGAARVERMLLVHRRPLGGSVHLARRDQDEPLDRRLADRVQQDLGALDVGGHELGGALLDRLLDVRLGGGVDDHVHLRDHVADELAIADVAVHEREARVRHQVGEVLEITCVGERVERDDLVRRRLEQVADEGRGDEPRAAGDEYALLAHATGRYRLGPSAHVRCQAPDVARGDVSERRTSCKAPRPPPRKDMSGAWHRTCLVRTGRGCFIPLARPCRAGARRRRAGCARGTRRRGRG